MRGYVVGVFLEKEEKAVKNSTNSKIKLRNFEYYLFKKKKESSLNMHKIIIAQKVKKICICLC